MKTKLELYSLTALRGSIKHWEENLAAKEPKEASTRAQDCPLCQIFLLAPKDYSRPRVVSQCEYGCPVWEFTGETGCQGTPYEKADDTLCDWRNGEATIDDWREAAKAELDFLKSLLPKGSEQ